MAKSNLDNQNRILDILQLGSPILTTPTSDVTDEQLKSPEFQKFIDDMVFTCESDKAHTAGLASPQVGKSYAITVVRRTDLEDKADEKNVDGSSEISEESTNMIDGQELWEVLINPYIKTKSSDEESLIWEACLSIGVGDRQLWGPVWRPKTVEIEYQSREGKTKSLTADGFFSHLLQHEIDHLKGILFTKYVNKPEENLWLAKDFNAYIKKHEAYPSVR